MAAVLEHEGFSFREPIAFAADEPIQEIPDAAGSSARQSLVADEEEAPASNKLPILIGLAAFLIFALGGGGVALVLMKPNDPVVVVPVGRDEKGLPVGVQLIGKRWDDERLLGIAQRVSEVVQPLFLGKLL